VSEALPATDLRAWITERLDPLEDREYLPGVDYAPDVADLFAGEPARAGVLIGLVERPHGFSVLLTRRADTLRNHTGQVAFPGGRCEPGETSWAAALREAEEEISLDRRFVSLAGLATPTVTHSGFLVVPAVGFVREGFRLSPNPHEVAEIFEAPLERVLHPDNYEPHWFELPDGRSGHYDAVVHEDRVIWGVTGRILRALHDRLLAGAPR
jgi:8-oxo-dGTP pyrophosphatase MutT (NUDIX family)